MAKGKHSKKGKKSNLQIRLNNEDFKAKFISLGHTGINIILGEESNLITSKLCTPEISVVEEFTEEEKALMKESNSSTMIKFIISTNGVDRDGDTIAVDGWNLKNFRKNPVVPWAHNYGEPPVARAIGTKVEGKDLVSKAMFTGKDLYPFGDMIGKMYRQKFLSAVSVGFNPSKFVFVEDSERKFGIDFLEQELLEYSAVPVPSNPEALIQARSKGIDIAPMKEYLEELLDHKANRKNLDMDVMEELINVFNNSTTTMGKTSDDLEEIPNEDGEHEDEIPDTADTDGDTIDGDNEDLVQDNDKDSDSLDSSQTEEDNQDYEVSEDMTLELCIQYSKDLLSGIVPPIHVTRVYDELKEVLMSNYDIKIFDFKYVDSKSLKNFPERFNFNDKTCLLTEKTQKDIDSEIIEYNEIQIKYCIDKIRKVDPNYKFEEKKEDITFDLDIEVEEKTPDDNGDTENVIDLEGIDNVEELRSTLKEGIQNSTQITFNKLTGKLN